MRLVMSFAIGISLLFETCVEFGRVPAIVVSELRVCVVVRIDTGIADCDYG